MHLAADARVLEMLDGGNLREQSHGLVERITLERVGEQAIGPAHVSNEAKEDVVHRVESALAKFGDTYR